MGIKQWLKQNHPDVVRILRLAKYEVKGQSAHLVGKITPNNRRRLRKLRRQRGLKLGVASGPVPIEGWLNIDVSPNADIRLDLRKKLPLADGSARMIFCEHFCDHISYPFKIRHFLKECHRLLEPGGVGRFVVHDARGLMKAFVENDAEYFRRAEFPDLRPIEAVNLLFRFNDSHQFMYDYELFRDLLLEAGFSEVRRCGYRESTVEGLAVDHVLDSRDVMSMYIEAVK